MNKENVIDALNQILEHELSGVVRYTHYSLMVFGNARIPIISWLRSQATESLTHAQAVGEYITSLGGHPSLKISKLLETHKHKIDDILAESLEHETAQLKQYEQLLGIVSGHIPLEEYSRQMIREEQEHIYEVEKMLKKPA